MGRLTVTQRCPDDESDSRIVLKETWLGPAYVRVDLGKPRKPRKKFRYAKRYYRNLDRRVATFTIDEGWCNFWHTHLDWNGEGDRSWADRRRHLLAEFALLRRAEAVTASWAAPRQVWLQICPADSWEDALWIHTPNPHSSFPHTFDGIDWTAPIPARWAEIWDGGSLEFGRSESGRTIFWVRSRGTHANDAAAG